jgi:tetratricopeptide (TPR) repeat protein
MKFRILLATVALIGTLCSACLGSKRCVYRTFAEIAVSYAAAGQGNQALSVAQKIDSLTLKAEVLSQIAVEFAKAGQTGQAAKLFTQALQIANKIESPPDKVMAQEAIAHQYGKVGQKNKAAEVLAQAVKGSKSIWGVSFVKDTVLERIAVNYAELGDYDQAIWVTDKIVDNIPKGRALARVIAQYLAVGEYDKARQVANMIEIKTSKANALIEISTKTGEYQQALSVAQEIDEDDSAPLKSIVLSKIVLLYSKSGQKKQAIEVLSQALNVAKVIKDTDTKVQHLARIALLYAQMGQKAQAAEISSQALQIASQNTDKKATLFTKVAAQYGNAGNKELADLVFPQALAMAQTLKNEDNKAHTLAELAIASANIQPYNQVLQLIQTIKDRHLQAYALTRIAKNFSRSQRQDEAAKILEQAFEIVKPLKNSDEKAQSLAEIAMQLGRIARFDRAIAVAQTIEATEKGSLKAGVLAKIAGYYAKAGHKEKAIEVLSQALQAANATKCS